MTLLADDLLLALLEPETGKPRTDGTSLEYGLAGALVVDLVLAGRVDLVEGKRGKAKVVVVDDTPPDDDLLADALRRLAEKQRPADQAVAALTKRLLPRLLERAEQRGDVRRERLALRPDRWPAADGTRQAAVTSRLHDVLVTGLTPDPRTTQLVALLAAIEAAPAAVGAPDRAARKAVARRAAEIGEGEGTAEAVRRALQNVHAAIAAATTAAVAASVAVTS